jgi:hypothetical protein
MRWAGRLELCIGNGKIGVEFWSENLRNLGVDLWQILKWILAQ